MTDYTLNLVMRSLTALSCHIGLGRKWLENRAMAHLKKDLRLTHLTCKFPYCHKAMLPLPEFQLNPCSTHFLNFVVFKVI